MRKRYVLLFICCCISLCYCISVNKEAAHIQVKRVYSSWVDSLQKSVAILQNSVEKKAGLSTLQKDFRNARLAYKHTELFAEYYNPATAKAINGPALDEVEPDNPGYPTPPTGLQVIEESLYLAPDSLNYHALAIQVNALKDAVARLASVSRELDFTDAHIFDAVRLEIFRLVTLGISGFDAPIAQTSLSECSEVLSAVKVYTSIYKQEGLPQYNVFIKGLEQCKSYLAGPHDFVSFNRAVFITGYVNPLCKQLSALQENLQIPYFKESRFLNADAATLFDKDAFNPYFYSTDHTQQNNPALIKLGDKLFGEAKLSANGSRSCASCHQPGKSYTDGLSKNNSFDGTRAIRRNTPTILYAALQPAQFADSRIAFLEDQAKQVIENPEEMHGNLSDAAVKLNADETYRQLFYAAFKEEKISEEKIQQALAAFIRSKSSFGSRFDEYMRGDASKMNTVEIAGFNLFMGKAKCGTCHFIPLFNGNAPPVYNKIESEVLGVPATSGPPYSLDKDEGKYALFRSAPHMNSFKTSTVRNSILTAPYMHNGVYKTMQEVIEFYNKGGGIGLGLKVDNQTLPGDKLEFTAAEKKSLVAFMHALTDE